jgi:hypothetical protein
MLYNTLIDENYINKLVAQLLNKDKLFSKVTQIIQTQQTLHQFNQLNIYKRHTNFAMIDLEYELDQLHIYKPIIKDYDKISSKKYIDYISKLFKIDKDTAIFYLKNFNGNVYNTILFG